MAHVEKIETPSLEMKQKTFDLLVRLAKDYATSEAIVVVRAVRDFALEHELCQTRQDAFVLAVMVYNKAFGKTESNIDSRHVRAFNESMTEQNDNNYSDALQGF